MSCEKNRLLGVVAILLLASIAFPTTGAAATRWRTSRATTYGLGAEIHSRSCTTLASGAGPLTTKMHAVAHRSLRFGTIVEIKFRYRGKWRSEKALVLDRGPYANHADLDLGPHVARATKLSKVGVGTVKWRVVGRVKDSRRWRRWKP